MVYDFCNTCGCTWDFCFCASPDFTVKEKEKMMTIYMIKHIHDENYFVGFGLQGGKEWGPIDRAKIYIYKEEVDQAMVDLADPSRNMIVEFNSK